MGDEFKPLTENNDLTPYPRVEPVLHEMECLDLKKVVMSDGGEVEIDNLTHDECKGKILHLQRVLSDKQAALDKWKEKCNDLTINIQQLKKDNEKLAKEKTSDPPTSHHPGGDLITSPPVTDAGLHAEIQIRDFKIAELNRYMEEYYGLVVQASEEKEQALKELQDSESDNTTLTQQVKEGQSHNQTLSVEVSECKSLNKKLTLQAQDLAEEKDRLYGKLSHSQSCLDAVTKERDDLLLGMSSEACSPSNTCDEVLKTKNEKLQCEIDSLRKHAHEQEEKIEKLTVRCGRAEEDLKRVGTSGRHNQPSGESDWRFRSLDEKDAKISNLMRDLERRDAEIAQLKHNWTLQQRQIEELNQTIYVLQQSYKASDASDAYAIKEQLKAFQDDYLAERQEKQKILEEQNKLRETNEALLNQLISQRSTDRNHPIHSNMSHSRQYTPTHPYHTDRSHEDLPFHGTARQPTHLPEPTSQVNAIPPRGYPTLREPCGQANFYPADPQYPPNIPPRSSHEVPRGTNHQAYVHRGQTQSSHK